MNSRVISLLAWAPGIRANLVVPLRSARFTLWETKGSIGTRFPTRLVLALLVTVFVASHARGQITNVTDNQSTPIPGAGHDYVHLLNETVNPANGSVSLRIGVPLAKGRGLTLPFAFAYDSNGAYIPYNGVGQGEWSSDASFLSQGGWSYSAPQVSYQSGSNPINKSDNC